MNARAGAGALVLVLVAAGCGTSGGGLDESPGSEGECVRLVVARAAEIAEAYKAGELPPGPARTFLDKYGPDLAMIPAEFEIADERPEQCGFLLDDVPEAGAP